jgi:hypothetical protein
VKKDFGNARKGVREGGGGVDEGEEERRGSNRRTSWHCALIHLPSGNACLAICVQLNFPSPISSAPLKAASSVGVHTAEAIGGLEGVWKVVEKVQRSIQRLWRKVERRRTAVRAEKRGGGGRASPALNVCKGKSKKGR